MDRTQLEQDVAAAHADLLRTRITLAQLHVPIGARLFGEHVASARHHLDVASLKLSNALAIGLPRRSGARP